MAVSPGFSQYAQDNGILKVGAQRTDRNRYWDGLIGEIIILSSYADDELRQIIEGYLAWKWDLVSSLPLSHPYKTEPPKR